MNKNKLFFIFAFLLVAVGTHAYDDAFAFQQLIASEDGNLKQQDLDYINSLIEDYNKNNETNLPDIYNWQLPMSETLFEGDNEYKSLTIENPGYVDYFFTKSGNFSQLWYVGGEDLFWESPNKKALSYVASPVPEPATVFLFLIGLMVVAFLQRKRFSRN